MTGDVDHNDTSNKDAEEHIDISYYRKLVRQFIDMRRYRTALFWAEKVCVLSQNDHKDVYCQAQCMFLLKEYHRAAHTIRLHELEKTNIPCFNLLLESLYEAKEFTEAINIMNSIDVEYLASSLINQPFDLGSTGNNSLYGAEDYGKNELLASVSLIKGKIYEAMDNRALAMDFYVQALYKSIYCYEALEALVQHQMLMAWEEKELMQHLPLAQQSTEADAKLIKKLYEAKMKKNFESHQPANTAGSILSLKCLKETTGRASLNRTTEMPVPKSNLLPKLMPNTQNMSPANKVLEDLKNTPFSLHVSLSRVALLINDSSMRSQLESSPGRNRTRDSTTNQNMLPLATCLKHLQKSTDMMSSEAEKLFSDCEYKKCFKILNELLKIDPYHTTGLTLQIGCLVEFGDYNKLFYVAHKLVDRYPDKAISWYAVGCYYDLIGKSEPARRFLSKATALDRLYGPAWLAYGHSFAKENEHDQAMAAYFKATQLMRGCHLPLLYIGVECGLTKNLELAEKFFNQSMQIAPFDVFEMHELGVIKYEYDCFESAAEVFTMTVNIVKARAQQNQEEVSARWEPLFNNLGHCCRKLRKYKEALEYHEYALLLKPQSAQTYTAIGYVHALMGDLEEAVVYFHKSLALNRDCIVTTTILKTCIEDLMEQDSIVDEICGKGTNSFCLKAPTTDSSKKISPSMAAALKYNRTKLKFELEDSATNADTNATMEMDISMDI